MNSDPKKSIIRGVGCEIYSLYDRVKKSEFLRSVSVLSLGNMFANFISFVSIPILSRVYTEEAFGEYAVMASFAAVLVVLTALGLRSAIMAPKSDVEARQLLTYVALVQTLLLTIIYFLSLLLPVAYEAPFIIGDGKYVISVSLIYIYSIFSGLNSLLAVYANKLKKNRVLFWNILINALALVVVTIPLGLLGMNGNGFMIGAISSAMIADIQMVIKTRPFARIDIKRQGIIVFHRYKDYVCYQFPSNVIGVYASQVPKQVFSYLFGNSSLGGYAMCEKILGIPSRLLGGPIGNTYFRQATIFVHNNGDLSGFTFRLIYRILAISVLPVIALILISDSLFVLVLGDNWSNVGVIVNIMVVPYVLGFCSSCLDYCLVVIDKQRINLFLTVVNFFFTIIFISGGYFIYGNFMGGVIGYALSLIFYHIVNLLSIFYFLRCYFYKMFIILLLYISVMIVFVWAKTFV